MASLASLATANVAGAEQLLRSSLVHYWAEVGYTDQSHQDDYAIPNSNMASNGQTTFPPALSVEQNGIGWSGDTINGLVDRLRELSESAHNKIERMVSCAPRQLPPTRLNARSSESRILNLAGRRTHSGSRPLFPRS